MQRKQAWLAAQARLQAAGVDTPALDARLLLEAATGITREQLLSDPYTEIAEEQQSTLETYLTRRAAREPMSHILGKREFYGRDFRVTADTLTPRPDSETLIDAVLSHFPPPLRGRVRVGGKDSTPPVPPPPSSPSRGEGVRILDLGTGTGCLLLTLLAEIPEAEGLGVDLSEAALSIARENAHTLGLQSRTRFLHSRWLAEIPPQTFEIVVANPPYIASNAVGKLMPEVARFEPHLALDGGDDGLACYREIAKQLPPYLAKHAIVALEVGEGQADAVADIFTNAGLSVSARKNDLAGIARCLVLTT